MRTGIASTLFLSLVATAWGAGPSVASVTNAASLASGPIAPGELIIISGSGFGATSTSSSGSPLPTTLANVTVTLGSTKLGLLSVSPSQINAVVPGELTPNASYQLVVQSGSALSAPYQVTVAATALGVFTADSSGHGQALAFAVDGTPNSISNPAAPGSVLQVYFTGGGQTNSDGSIPQNVVVGVNNAGVALLYAGLTPNLPGYYQVNIQTSPGTSGVVPITIGISTSSGFVNSQGGVTIATGTSSLSPSATLSVLPTSLTFTTGGTVPPPQTISVSSSGSPISFTASSSTDTGVNWLGVQNSTGTTPASVGITVNPAGLPPNSYAGTVAFTYSGGEVDVPVTLTVQQQPTAPAVNSSIITTIAGTNFTFPSSPLPALNAPLGQTSGVAVDAKGNVYVADRGNNLVMQFVPGGQMTVVAGNGIAGFSGDGGPATSASLNSPTGVAVDSAGNLYIADYQNGRVRKVSGGTITTVAGNGNQVFSGDGGPATSASLLLPAGVAVDSSGSLYIADSGNLRVRKVSDGIITTFAGNGGSTVSGDGGAATSASLGGPFGLAIDSAGALYIADTGRVWKVLNGTITIVAGGGTNFPGDGGPATSALFVEATGVAVDSAGNIYIADFMYSRIRKVSGGTITTVAGNGTSGFSGDGGLAASAILGYPLAVAVDFAGNLEIADTYNGRVRKITSGIITTVAGNGAFRFSGDGGPATSASLNTPAGVAVDLAGNFYITDQASGRIRKVSGGTITTIAGNGVLAFSGDGGPATGASFFTPRGIAVDSVGAVYIADSDNNRIRKVSSGTITTVAGNGSFQFSGDGGPATNAELNQPYGVAVDLAGNLYIADTGNSRIRKVSNGTITTVAGNGNQGFSGDGGPATSASLGEPYAVAVDSAGNLYIADGNCLIRKVSGGIITTVAGNGNCAFSSDGAPATSASLSYTAGIAVDSAGNLYIVDEYSRIRKVSGGIITTVAGNGNLGFSGDGGPATGASLDFNDVFTDSTAGGVAVDSTGNLYIADTGNNRIREVFSSAVSYRVTPASVSFSTAANGTAPATQAISLSSSVAGLAFATSTNASWLSVSPSSGAMPAVLQVSVDPTGLTPNTYQGSITITAPNASPSTQTIGVSLTISGGTPSQLAVSTTSIPFSLAQGANPATAQFTISNTGSGSARYAVSVTSVNNLLQASATNGSVTATSPVNVIVTATPGTLGPGTYTGTIVITGPDTGQTLTVTVIVAITGAPPTILLSQLGFTFTAVSQGGTVLPQTLGILNSGTGTLTYSAQATTQSGGSGWLSVSSNSGTVTRPLLDVSFIDVNVDANQLPPPGTYYGQIVVSASGAGNSPQTALVVLNVLPAGSNPGPDVRPTGLVFIGVAGGESPGSQNVTVANVTATPLTVSATVSSPGEPGLIDSQPTNFTVPPDAPQLIRVQPNLTSLSAGPHRAGILVYTADGQSQIVNTLTVVAPAGTPTGDVSASRDRPLATPACTPTKLLPQFTATGFNLNLTIGYPAFVAATVVDDCTVPMTTGFVTLSFDNGDPPISLISTQDGNWTNSWQPSHPTNSVTLTLTAASNNLTGTTLPTPAGAVKQGAGSQTPPLLTGAPLGVVTLSAGPFAPGDLMLLKGTGLADGQESSSSTALKNQLAGAQVAIGQAGLISLLYADATQVVGLVPSSLQPNSSQAVIVQRDSALGVQVPVIISTTHPAILTVNGSGQGQGSIYKSTGAATTLANSANPVSTGDSIIVYCTGLGVTNADGSAANIPMLTIGGVTAHISYAGVALPASYPTTGAPMLLGLVSSSLGGLYQITATVPAGVATGAAAVTITSAGQTSQSGVTIIVGGQGSSTPPSITPGGVVNAASYAALPVSPGALVAIFTSALAAQPASFSTASLPPSLGGVSVSFNGVTAPMVGVSPSGAYPFISAQVPFEVLAAGQISTTVPVVVTVNGVPSAAVQTPIVASSPGIFTIPPTGQGNAVLVNLSDYSIAAPAGSIPGLNAHPIARGQTAFFYVTGLGAMTPSVADGSGSCPASNGLCNANALPTVLVGGVPATASAVQAPGFPGVVQINIAIPQSAPTGSAVSLIVKSKDGTVTSNTATIAVQ